MTKLEKMLKYVAEHNEFYKNRIKEYCIRDPLDITQWPVLTRKELQENRYNMFSDGYMTKYSNQQLHRQSSSGSSGIPVNTYWDYKDWYASSMSLWRKRMQWYEIKPSDKGVLLSLSAFNLKTKSDMIYYVTEPSNMLYVNISLVQNEIQYVQLLKLINSFAPSWLYIQPFMLDSLVRKYKQYGLIPPKSLRYIESYGEILSFDVRTRASSFFNIPIVNMYGAEEIGAIAFESKENHMCVLEDNVYVEIKNNNVICSEGKGELLATSLNNHSMPLIRYSLGDSGEVCRRVISEKSLIEIVTISGRTVDTIKLENDQEINAILLMELITEANNLFNDCIIDYKYNYCANNKKLVCNIVMDTNTVSWFRNVKNTIESIFYNKLIHHSIDFQVVLNKPSSFMHCKNRILELS